MVSAQPAPTDSGAARDAEPEATRSRRLLRGDGELLLVEPYESDRGANLAEVAFSAQLERLLRLGEPVGTAGAVSAAGSPGRPLSVPARVNRWPDEPDAVIPHVRICGSPGWVTAQGDPATLLRSQRIMALLRWLSTYLTVSISGRFQDLSKYASVGP